MGRTVQVIADRVSDDAVIVEPQETSSPYVRVQGSPGATALKVLHLMHAHAGVSIAEDIEHAVAIRALREESGLRQLSVGELRDVIDQLTEVRLELNTVDNEGNGKIQIGALVAFAQVNVHAYEAVQLRWHFGPLFRQEAARSDHWAMIDKPVLMALRSRYAITLLEHLSGLAWRQYRSQKLSLDQLRRVLGVPPGRLAAFSHLRQRALDPAVAELTELSRFNVTYEVTRATGRSRRVAGIVLKWDLREASALPPPLAFESPEAPTDVPTAQAREARLRFPSNGQLRWDDDWEPLARDHGHGRDIDWLGQEFVKFCRERNIPLDAQTIRKTFISFCQRQKPLS